jgi:hypothetical protein
VIDQCCREEYAGQLYGGPGFDSQLGIPKIEAKAARDGYPYIHGLNLIRRRTIPRKRKHKKIADIKIT